MKDDKEETKKYDKCSIMNNKKNPRTFVECNTGTCHDCILYFHNLKAINCERRLDLIQKEELIWSDDEGWINKDSLKNTHDTSHMNK